MDHFPVIASGFEAPTTIWPFSRPWRRPQRPGPGAA